MSAVDYQPLGDVYDEMLDADGRPRPHWEQLAAAFGDIGVAELQRRRLEAARLLDQDGVVYNARADTAETAARSVAQRGVARRGWRLDPLPTILSSREWAEIEQGVIERAELLAMVLEDIYGERELLRRGLLPPEIVLGHRGFIRAADGIRHGSGPALFAYAADLGRRGDGEVVVLADRTQAPSGAAYALENRSVISRVLPTLYRDSQVHRLSPFLRMLRSALQAAAPAGVEDPRVVVLTPGPLHETAYEHAALASRLGFPLVQGRDLTVRDQRVWMRSVGQLEPVDVILRRVDDAFCDPLELRPDSQLGVPGLLEVARLGRVAIVNPIGAAVMENPALMAFLPAVGRHLLGREPRLAGVRTWWCGEPEGCAHVLAHLEELVVASATGGTGMLLGAGLSRAGREELARRIRARPRDWVGQESLAMSSVPVLADAGLESRRAVLRTFATARHDSYAVMPGGLTRVESEGGAVRIANATGAVTKDTWVLASEPEPLSALWLSTDPAPAGVDAMATIPRGAAESLWWLGRYAERAEALTRLTRAVADRQTEFSGRDNAAGAVCLRVLERTLADLARASAPRSGPVVDPDAGVDADTSADGVSGSDEAGGIRAAEGMAAIGGAGGAWAEGTRAISRALRSMLDDAYAVRDQLSRDTWLVIGPLEQAIAELERPQPAAAPVSQAALARVIHALLAFGGLGVESMVRDLGWRFMDAGRRLERSLSLLALFSATVTQSHGAEVDVLVLESVLSAAESIITYRFRYRSHAQLDSVLELLLLDADNPRSLAYQLAWLDEDLRALPRGIGDGTAGDGAAGMTAGRLSPEQRQLLEASTALALTDPEALVAGDAQGGRGVLADLLDTLAVRLRAVGDGVDRAHFIHTAPRFALLGTAGSDPNIGAATIPEFREESRGTGAGMSAGPERAR